MRTPAFRGRLIGESFARDVLPGLSGAALAPPDVCRQLEAWFQRSERTMGPAASIRAITDVIVVPLLEILGLMPADREDTAAECVLRVTVDRLRVATAIVVGWGESPDRAWRTAILRAVSQDQRWCLCCNGLVLRIVDARRTWSRDYLEIDLALLAHDDAARALVWTLLSAGSLAANPPLLDRAVDLSARHGVEICRTLGNGVLDALATLVDALATHRRRHAPQQLFDHSLMVLYRVLFLLFAEARGLVPMWHPIYRDRYSLDAVVGVLLAGRRYRGLWQTLSAISRMAHSGCSAGDLQVTAFNGRLFSPSRAAAFDGVALDDDVIGRAVIAVSTVPAARHGRSRIVHSAPSDSRDHRRFRVTPTRHGGPRAASRRVSAAPPDASGRTRIVYRDLDVEQLGSVYERVLEYEPARRDDSMVLTHTRERRKSSGTFYTPRAVTALLVRTTLEPLVRDRAADDILALRVLDPAMGSGAFLVAACRYLAVALEDALIREGRWHPGDITAADRAGLRRELASRCLYGVDLNPTAVQLARLSLWIATLAADRPLSFLDHHLMAGDSLIGATPADLLRQPRGSRDHRGQADSLPLFAGEELSDTLAHAVRLRALLGSEPDASAAVVHEKERRLTALQNPNSSTGRWWRVLDLWCAGWFWDADTPPDRATFRELSAHLLHEHRSLPAHLVAPLLARAETIAKKHRFLHWPLACPEIFSDAHGEPLANPGFDAVVGNPPWDMVRGDIGAADLRAEHRLNARHLTRFVRESGIYAVETRAHVNRYQLFVERALQMVRTGGRIGLVLPSGMANDTGAAALRRHMFERADVDSITGMDNRHGIFPIHRSVRFVLVTATAGRPTHSISCRFGIHRIEALESSIRPGPADDTLDRQAHMPLLHPDSHAVLCAPSTPLRLTRRFLARLSGDDDLGIPELATELDLRLVEKTSAVAPWLGSHEGWNVRFGRELNATDDRHAFVPYRGDVTSRPVVEGKQLEPFRVLLDRCRLEIAPEAESRLRVLRRTRLAYRDVASATNRLTLIAALIPSRAVTTHTLLCLKEALPLADQRVLCALLNSFVTNYLVRLRVTTHVTAALISRLPVPVVRAGHPQFERLAFLAQALAEGHQRADAMPEYVELQVIVASLYALHEQELAHILSTFPLVPSEIRSEVLLRFAKHHSR